MRTVAIAAGIICLSASPANAERLKAFEVYQILQGDWAQSPSSTDGENACAKSRVRLKLDATGLVLTVQYLNADMTAWRSNVSQLKSLPSRGDSSVFLEFFGPDIDYERTPDDWQELLSISMRDPDQLTLYFGYAEHPPFVGPDGRKLMAITPHGYGDDFIRCHSAPRESQVPSDE